MNRPHLTRAPAIAAAVAFLSPVVAQQWRMPERGAAIYERETEWEVEPLDGQSFTSAGGHQRRVPPLLFDAELARDGKGLARTPFDLHGIGPALAFDRSLRRRVSMTLPMVHSFGDVRLTGTVEPVDDQRDLIVVRVSRQPARPADRELARSMEHYMPESLAGEIRVTRRWDGQLGAVAELIVEADLTYSSTSGSDPYRYRRTGSERWVLTGFRTGADPEFATEVNGAIDAARDGLLEQLQDPDGASMAGDEVAGPLHGPALLARRLRAVAMAGVGRDHPTVAGAVDSLVGRDLRHPRALSEAILALAALDGTAAADREQTRARGEAQRTRRRVPAADRRQLEVWVEALLEAADPAFDPSEVVVWGFHADHSDHAHLWQTTRAIEALLVADRCGVKVPKSLWRTVTAGVLLEQFRPGDGGWCDRGFEGPNVDWSQGHTTAAAVAALRGLRPHLDRRLQRQVDAAVKAGLAWLAEAFEPRICPSPHPVFWQHHPEWCEALPLALERSGVEELDGRDWYFEMAQTLLAGRGSNGSAGTTVAGTPGALSVWRRSALVPTTGAGR